MNESIHFILSLTHVCNYLQLISSMWVVCRSVPLILTHVVMSGNDNKLPGIVLGAVFWFTVNMEIFALGKFHKNVLKDLSRGGKELLR